MSSLLEILLSAVLEQFKVYLEEIKQLDPGGEVDLRKHLDGLVLGVHACGVLVDIYND